MRVLLTGGSGFIGRNIRESYLSKKHEILAPTHPELELMDELKVEEYFKKNDVDVVIHGAVKPSHRNAQDTKDLFLTNTRLFFNLVRCAEHYDKMLLIGSGAVYDIRFYEPKIEEDHFDKHIPVDELGFMKYVCYKYIEKTDNIVDLRMFGIFGKYEDYSIRFISNAICKTLFDLPITIKQNRKFDYLFVDDLMPVLKHFIETKKLRYSAYNVTPDRSIELRKLAELVLRISGKDLPIKVAEEGLGIEYSGSNARLRHEMPRIKFTAIENAVEQLYKWYYKNKDSIDKSSLLIDK